MPRGPRGNPTQRGDSGARSGLPGARSRGSPSLRPARGARPAARARSPRPERSRNHRSRFRRRPLPSRRPESRARRAPRRPRGRASRARCSRRSSCRLSGRAGPAAQPAHRGAQVRLRLRESREIGLELLAGEVPGIDAHLARLADEPTGHETVALEAGEGLPNPGHRRGEQPRQLARRTGLQKAQRHQHARPRLPPERARFNVLHMRSYERSSCSWPSPAPTLGDHRIRPLSPPRPGSIAAAPPRLPPESTCDARDSDPPGPRRAANGQFLPLHSDSPGRARRNRNPPPTHRSTRPPRAAL